MKFTSSFYPRYFAWIPLVMACTVAVAAPHKLRVTDPAVAQSLTERGGRLVADYGSFQLLEVDDIAAANGNPAVQVVDDLNIIQLNARPLDTRKPEIQALRKPAAALVGKRLHLIQFAGPVKPEWATALEETGVRLITYIPQNSYLVYGDAPAIGKMQGWARNRKEVQWEGDYTGDLKVHPRARSMDEKGNPRNPAPGLFAVQLVEDAAANPATLALIDQIRTAPVQSQSRTLHYLNVVVHLPANRIDDLAARPEVVSIQPYEVPKKRDERQNQIVAGNLTGSGPNGPGYLAWLTSKGFSQAQFAASGFGVDVTDSGVDNGSTIPGHFGLYTMGDPAQNSRVIYARLEGTPHAGSSIQGCDGHGNINAHIIGGFNDLPSGFPHTDSAGYHYGLGICPFVKVGSSVIFDPDAFTNPNYANLQSRAYRDGARISANSWGADVAGAYTIDSQSYDALVRDAQPSGSSVPNTGNQQMVIVFASGNAGSGAQTVGSPGTGKNVITVGASENVRSMSTANGGNNTSGNDGCNLPDSGANSANDIIDFSSRGPCSDGRQKPDLVAPGTHITGGVAQAGAPTTNGIGSAIACFDGTGVCALPGGGTTGDADNFFPLAQQFYTASSGTSHSTPAIAGACALLRQFFINNSFAPPSPAMTKAFLVNSSRYLNGVSANDNLWSPHQGMGAVNIGTAFDGISRVVRDQLPGDKFTASGQTRTITGTIADPTKPFRVTLAWTDAPGNTTGNSYNNDLDLTVTVGGNSYKGNNFNGAFSVTGGVADNKNNMESVFVPAGLTGNFTVTVRAANINSDGVPNEAPSLDQDFALVVYNAAEGFVPVLQLDGAAIIAESCSPSNGAVDAGETVTVAFTIKNAGSANTTNLVVTLLTTNGVTSPSGPQAYGVIATNGGSVTRSFSFTASGACGGVINPVLQCQDGSTVVETMITAFDLGARFYTTNNATNAANIHVPGSGKSGPASPYPSTIAVSGVAGNVSRVTVTLVGASHQYPDDVDVLLVGPTGQTVLLMSDCGGGSTLSGQTLTFDDNAAGYLSDSSTIVSGSYKPTEYETATDVFQSPAPAGPYGQLLSAFNGLNPNGNWLLYARDDASADSGSIAQGWRLSITTFSNVCCTFNSAPSISSIPDVSTNENSTLGPISFTIGDAETAPTALTLTKSSSNTNLVPTASILFGGSGSNRTVTIVPASNQSGSATITVTVSDGVASTSSSFLATFNEVNQAPTLNAIADKTVAELSAHTFTSVATDNDIPSQTLVYSITNAPAGASIHPSSGLFSWTPTEGQGPGVYPITVIVTDNGSPQLSDAKTFYVTVNEVNSAPTLSGIPDQTLHAGTTLLFTNTASDLDLPANTLTFSLGTNPPTGITLNASSGLFSWTPTDEQVGTNAIIVQVSDNGSPILQDAKTVSVFVLARPALSISNTGTNLVLSWIAIPGTTYEVQSRTNLDAGAWSNLTSVSPASSPATVNDAFGETTKFYRLILP